MITAAYVGYWLLVGAGKLRPRADQLWAWFWSSCSAGRLATARPGDAPDAGGHRCPGMVIVRVRQLDAFPATLRRRPARGPQQTRQGVGSWLMAAVL